MIDGLVGATEDLIKETGLQIFVIGSSANPTQNVYIDDQLVGIFRERQKKFIPLDKFKDKYLPGHIPNGANLIPKKSGDFPNYSIYVRFKLIALFCSAHILNDGEVI